MGKVKTGGRYRSRACGTEVIVVKCANESVELTCGGWQMSALGEEFEKTTPREGLRTGNELGKRYADDSGLIEVLVTKAGEGTLGSGESPLLRKESSQLPASD